MELNKYTLLVENPMVGQVIELEPTNTQINNKDLRKVYLRSLGSDKIYLAMCILESLNNFFIITKNPAAYPFFNTKALIETSIPTEDNHSSDSICVRMLAKVETSPNIHRPQGLEGVSLLIVQIDEVNKHFFKNMMSSSGYLTGATVH